MTTKKYEWADWRAKLCGELTNLFGYPGEEYITGTGEQVWRETFNDGVSPYDAAHEEYLAACEMVG